MAAPEYFTIFTQKQPSGTKHYLTASSTASGDVVTLTAAKKDKKAKFHETQVWSKDTGGSSDEAFFLYSKSNDKSKPDHALVDDGTVDGPIGLRQTGMRWEMEPYREPGTDTPPMDNTQGRGNMAHKYFTISQEYRKDYHYVAAYGTTVKLTGRATNPYTDGQVWEKKEAFVVRSKSIPECTFVEQLPPADSQIELRQTMDGLWKSPPAKDDLIYIQKASDPTLVFDAKFERVVLEVKRKPGSSKETSRWKMEPYRETVNQDEGAATSRSARTNREHIDTEGSNSGGGQLAFAAQAVPTPPGKPAPRG